jgi:trehalose 6-phosphate phosphatase
MTAETALTWPSDAAMRRALAALAAHPHGLFSDVDGTLSALAPMPEIAVLLPGVADLLRRAVSAFEVVAAVSGRSASDARHLVGLPELIYIGNHGLEQLEPAVQMGNAQGTSQSAAQVSIRPEALPYQPTLAPTLEAIWDATADRFPGIRIEHKGVTASVHVRGTTDPDAAEAAVYAAALEAAAPYGLRVTRGKRVVELRPPLDVDKGVAVAELIASRGLAGALYLGDDATDRDAFRALRRLTAEGACQGVSVVVLHPEAPEGLAAEADIALPSIEQVPAFLRWVVEQAERR